MISRDMNTLSNRYQTKPVEIFKVYKTQLEKQPSEIMVLKSDREVSFMIYMMEMFSIKAFIN